MSLASASTASLAGCRVVVMGLGQFGGGVGVARFLASQGARILITDMQPQEKLQQGIDQLADLQIEYRLGEHLISDFTAADLIVVSPAVKPMNNPYLAAAQQAGVPLTSEIRLLTQRLPNRQRTIGITGSAGKSTTTAMVGHIMASMQQRVFVGGNLGGSLLPRLGEIQHDDWVVLELSSFMLEGLRQDRWSPHIALITNLAPNHLDWHNSVEHYRAAKQVLLDFQSDADDDIAILGPGAEGFTSTLAPSQLRALHDTSQLLRDIPALLIPGEHNRINAAMAVQVCVAAGFDRDEALAQVATFAGLPHRLQFVVERDGVRYFNDSKCTTPEAAMLALRSFEPGKVHLIAGGYDKGSDLTPLARFAKARCKSVHTIGVTGPAIAAAAEAAPGDARIIRSETLEGAMQSLRAITQPGDIVLLSPACASWDQFTNYEARGAAFIELAT